jgi:hypothetical protein
MKIRTAALLAVVLAAGYVSLPASPLHMPVDEIRPGMTGLGRTVFQGTETEEFEAHILGVLRNVMGPQRHLILARLEGGPLAETGVIAGMSGSPVYIEGRLIGAVSYSIGAFSKEPIAGITPIAEMIEAVALPGGRTVREMPRLDAPVTAEGLAAVLRQTFGRLRAFAVAPGETEGLGLPAAAGGQLGAMLRPIATPMVMSGFEPEAMELMAGVLRESGFVPVVGGGAGGGEAAGSGGRLGPGDAVGVSLIRGDLEMGGTGTVTHVDGDRLYAFGHPFFNLGPAQFPMTRAYVYSLLPSLMSSFKISSVGEVIGTIEQDRATTVAGTLGAGPKMIPVRIALKSDRGLARTFSFELVNDQLFTPLLTYVSIFNTLGSWERQFGAATFSVRGTTRLKGHPAIDFEDVFTGDTPALGVAGHVAGPISLVLSNDLAPVEIEGVDIEIQSSEQPRTATIARVWLDDVRPRPGRTVPLRILLRTYRGEEMIQTVPLEIPANASGSLTVLVSDGSNLAQWEQRELRRPLQPQSVEQMIRLLNSARKNNRLYVKLLSSNAGAIVNGEPLSALPPSVLAIYEGERNGGNVAPLRNAPIGEWELATGHAVRGSRLLTINVESE